MTKKWAFLYLYLAAFCFALSGIPFLLGAWFPILYFILAAGLISFGAWLYLHRDQLFDFLKAKSTKNGLSNGATILLGFMILVGVNFISVRYNKSIDITKDQVNTLSEESLGVVDELETPLVIKAYYQGKQHAQERIILKKIFNLYERASSKVSSQIVDAHSDPSASEDLTADDYNKLVVLIKQNGKTERVADPISEESITTAMIRIKTQSYSQVYFTMGHGERSINDDSGFGLSNLKQLLESRGFKASELSLFNAPNGKVPEDASIVVVMGPKKDFLAKEIEILKEFGSKGGKVLLAVDPEAEVNIKALTKEWGVTYNRNFVASFQSIMPLIVIGSEFSHSSAITEKFANAQVLFPLAGSLTADPENEAFNYEPLVSTNEYSFSVKSPQEIERVMTEAQSTGQIQGQVFELAGLITKKPKAVNPLDPHGIEAAENESFLKEQQDEEKAEDFMAVFFADSDFASNEYIYNGFNKDLILNSMVYLSGQKDLITIRPNEAQPTTIKLSPTGFNVASVFGLSVPFIFLVMTVVFWIRRRSM